MRKIVANHRRFLTSLSFSNYISPKQEVFIYRQMEENTRIRAPFDASINCMFFYGTLRDDDDTGAPWAGELILGASGRHGYIRGYKMFQRKEDSFPFIIHTKNENDIVKGRILTWDRDQPFEEKLIKADQIEGYDGTDSSFYVRGITAVMCQHNDNDIESVQETKCYFYYRQIDPVAVDAIELSSGDWLKRHQFHGSTHHSGINANSATDDTTGSNSSHPDNGSKHSEDEYSKLDRSTTAIFFYGSMRDDIKVKSPWAVDFMNGSEKIYTAILSGYIMKQNTMESYPFIMRSTPKDKVTGRVFVYPDFDIFVEQLKKADIIEDFELFPLKESGYRSKMYYHRALETVRVCGDNGENFELKAWVYYRTEEHPLFDDSIIIQSGDWLKRELD